MASLFERILLSWIINFLVGLTSDHVVSFFLLSRNLHNPKKRQESTGLDFRFLVISLSRDARWIVAINLLRYQLFPPNCWANCPFKLRLNWCSILSTEECWTSFASKFTTCYFTIFT